jgi:hypothetical protein
MNEKYAITQAQDDRSNDSDMLFNSGNKMNDSYIHSPASTSLSLQPNRLSNAPCDDSMDSECKHFYTLHLTSHYLLINLLDQMQWYYFMSQAFHACGFATTAKFDNCYSVFAPHSHLHTLIQLTYVLPSVC